MKIKLFKKVLLASLFLSASSMATIVEFQTSHGNFQVNLFDQSTPETVTNFLTYVNEGNYNNTVIHRSIPNFVVQGGGYSFEGDFPLIGFEANPAVNNEPVWSNVRGTIAMAKLPNQPDSATNQWFFNVIDNSDILDLQNDGFTVFGSVIDNGMQVVDEISAIDQCSDIPMPDYSADDCSNESVPGVENFVTIHQIVIVDATENTEDDLSPEENVLIDIPPLLVPDENSGSSGGSSSWLMLGLLSLLSFKRRAKLII